jgi:mannitol-1-/sugar-/sorbitol-6-/2-deoxyglucose-6-phosphatase
MMHAAIFDMDGLLIDSEPLWRKAEIECFKLVGIELTEQDCRDTMGYRLNEVIEHWYKRQPWSNLSLEELDDIIINRVIELIQTEGKAMAGVYSSLELFKKLGFKTAVASSSPYRLIHAVLDAIALKDYFEVVHSAEDELFGKPHPQVFLSTAQKLNVLPENCVVLEDSFHGIIAGKAAKMKVIGIPDSESIKNRQYQAADLILHTLEAVSSAHIEQFFNVKPSL